MITSDLLIAGAWKSAAVLCVAFAAAWLLRRGSAALRHFLWTAAFAVLLLLPFLQNVRPVRLAAPAIAVAAIASPAPALPIPAAANWAAWIWAAGAFVVFARFLAGALRVWWLSRRIQPARYAQTLVAGLTRSKTRVFDSAAIPIPLAWGILRPAILLPAHAREWPLDRLAAVLRHELAHISRCDLAAQYLTQAACCLYWFQPLAWLAARRQRRERELACDDAVLASGIAADQYASHLIEVTRAVAARRARGLNATAMAASPDLESRVRSLFTRHDRRPLRARMAMAVSALILAVGLPVASLHLYAQTARGSITGHIEDPSGARVPACTVTAKNLDGANVETASCNRAGDYRLASIPPGHYSVTVNTRGFKAMTLPMVVTPNVTATLDVALTLGDVTESVTVTGQKPVSGFSPSAGSTPQKVRVGGAVTPCMLITARKPQYPPDLQQAGVEGVVLIRAVISKEGVVLNPVVINTVAEQAFSQAALDAVRTWRYKPSTLNGEPVESATTITIDFKLDQ
ncbi:MAG TPA: M56 family metallopeptidase [Verrucomicrobiae bacterium]|nr:M56 family metallopeptidase [Verrucomicrobiae bacterium]